MDTELQVHLDAQDQKLEAIYASVEKTRKYLLVAMWVTIVTVALPIVGLVVAIPMFLNSYMSAFEGLL